MNQMLTNIFNYIIQHGEIILVPIRILLYCFKHLKLCNKVTLEYFNNCTRSCVRKVKDRWLLYKTKSSNQEFINENWNLSNNIIKVLIRFFFFKSVKHSYWSWNKQYNLRFGITMEYSRVETLYLAIIDIDT